MKKIIYILLGFLVVGAGGFFWYEQKVEKDLNDFVATTRNLVATSSVYVLADVAKHASKSDCWMVIDGSVYDVTSFVDKHPGGEVILEGCGKDATTYFNQVPSHMKGIVQAILNKLKIGEIKN